MLVDKCECGRVRKYRDWHMPTLENGMLREITENIHRITFIDRKCPACKVKK